ncbi:cytochrome d ubiquinol oxidase subunit II [Novosphingobium sp. BL-52-GroH]|uniref:cytochrome d ubiquinol oxidase subunit II n=1 Tax=Novosphingobium sp. BL-52-GroH TaxID=3349877 RepID=UPI0038512B8A
MLAELEDRRRPQDQVVTYAGRLGIALLAVIGAVSLATLTLEASYQTRWLSWPGILGIALLPLVTVIVTALLYRSLSRRRDVQPFFWALALFGLYLLGLGFSIWPYVTPARVTIWEAAVPYRSQLFMLVGRGVLVPVILAYTAWAYWGVSREGRQRGLSLMRESLARLGWFFGIWAPALQRWDCYQLSCADGCHNLDPSSRSVMPIICVPAATSLLTVAAVASHAETCDA